MTLEEAHAIVAKYGQSQPRGDRAYCNKAECRKCAGRKRDGGHGLKYYVGEVYVPRAELARVQEAQAMVRDEIARLANDPQVRRARELLELGPRKARAKSIIDVPIVGTVGPK